MDWNQYQQKVISFLSPASKADQLVNSCLGLSGETGEVVDLVKKHLHHGHELDKEKFKRELGDALFYIAEAGDSQGITLQEIAETNIAKLTARYPTGVFTTEDSKAKKDEQTDLRAIIESVQKETGHVALIDMIIDKLEGGQDQTTKDEFNA